VLKKVGCVMCCVQTVFVRIDGDDALFFCPLSSVVCVLTTWHSWILHYPVELLWISRCLSYRLLAHQVQISGCHRFRCWL